MSALLSVSSEISELAEFSTLTCASDSSLSLLSPSLLGAEATLSLEETASNVFALGCSPPHQNH
ncbi:hypothetical protein [Amygdalobacter nucleatus]|uniref:Uncharacterized protein n=1 Tax=Amygdalobacter nucleatus TaxID=3029274 RepID=A0A133Y772_9FIRM|nr:hypothetical protein [Amygdalobacter nucleatus]KXB39036.1 hypothetical protein HMPREF1872_01358 [Amygdalobacter nucleatus]MDF0485232.1 hypothetical protein [Amygdalobacter nucleatus]